MLEPRPKEGSATKFSCGTVFEYLNLLASLDIRARCSMYINYIGFIGTRETEALLFRLMLEKWNDWSKDIDE